MAAYSLATSLIITVAPTVKVVNTVGGLTSNGSFDLSVNIAAGKFHSLYIGNGGSSIYAIDDQSPSIQIHSGALGTPYDITSIPWMGGYNSTSVTGKVVAGFAYAGDGSRFYTAFASGTAGLIYEWSSPGWDATIMNYSAQTSAITLSEQIAFSADGTKLYTLAANILYTYTLASAWAISSPTVLENVDFSPLTTGTFTDLSFSDAGDELILLDTTGQIVSLQLATPFLVSSYVDKGVRATSPVAVGSVGRLVQSGNVFYIVDKATAIVYQYTPVPSVASNLIYTRNPNLNFTGTVPVTLTPSATISVRLANNYITGDITIYGGIPNSAPSFVAKLKQLSITSDVVISAKPSPLTARDPGRSKVAPVVLSQGSYGGFKRGNNQVYYRSYNSYAFQSAQISSDGTKILVTWGGVKAPFNSTEYPYGVDVYDISIPFDLTSSIRFNHSYTLQSPSVPDAEVIDPSKQLGSAILYPPSTILNPGYFKIAASGFISGTAFSVVSAAYSVALRPDGLGYYLFCSSMEPEASSFLPIYGYTNAHEYVGVVYMSMTIPFDYSTAHYAGIKMFSEPVLMPDPRQDYRGLTTGDISAVPNGVYPGGGLPIPKGPWSVPSDGSGLYVLGRKLFTFSTPFDINTLSFGESVPFSILPSGVSTGTVPFSHIPGKYRYETTIELFGSNALTDSSDLYEAYPPARVDFQVLSNIPLSNRATLEGSYSSVPVYDAQGNFLYSEQGFTYTSDFRHTKAFQQSYLQLGSGYDYNSLPLDIGPIPAGLTSIIGFITDTTAKYIPLLRVPYIGNAEFHHRVSAIADRTITITSFSSSGFRITQVYTATMNGAISVLPAAKILSTAKVSAALGGFSTNLDSSGGGQAYLGGFQLQADARGQYRSSYASLKGPIFQSQAFGGAGSSLAGFGTALLSQVSAPTYITANLAGFSSSINADLVVGSRASAYLNGFAKQLASQTGGTAVLPGFLSKVTVSSVHGSVAVGQISKFGWSILAVVSSSTTAVSSLRPPNIALLRGEASLSGYSTKLVSGSQGFGFEAITSTPTQAYAYVMNLVTEETTRYTQYDFMYIVRLMGQYYGVKNDGLYLLEGASDNGSPINAKVRTKDMSLGTQSLKRVPYIYLDTEDALNTTTIVEGQTVSTYSSSFGGRRTRLARGPKGKYWAFEVSNVDGGPMRLSGLSPVVEKLKRKI